MFAFLHLGSIPKFTFKSDQDIVIAMTFIQLVSDDGAQRLVNRYFLQLYNEYFHNLMVDHQNDNIVLFFTGESTAYIESFINDVNLKHINCSNLKNPNCEDSELILINENISCDNIDVKNFNSQIEDNSKEDCNVYNSIIEKKWNCLKTFH